MSSAKGSPKPPALGSVPTSGFMINQEAAAELLPCRCLWCGGFQPYCNCARIQDYFFLFRFSTTLWAQASQPSLTFVCRRKGCRGPANLAAIKDVNYVINNKLRRVRDCRPAPQPVLKDRDVYRHDNGHSTGQSPT